MSSRVYRNLLPQFQLRANRDAAEGDQQENLPLAFNEEEPPPRREVVSTGAGFYFAYGSNLSIEQMAHRCPGAKPAYKHAMRAHRLVFRGAADIVRTGNPEDFVPGVMWTIEPKHEAELDRYEGVAGGVYRKTTFNFWTPARNKRKALVYRKNSLEVYPPKEAYLARISSGYARFSLDMSKLTDALDFSRRNPGMTYHD